MLKTLKPPSNDLRHLDVLRFLACVAIVFHHTHIPFYPTEMQAAVSHNTIGLALFVDLFFTISGFVIAWLYDDRVSSLAEYFDFMKRRIARLMPLHVLMLALAGMTIGLATIAGFSLNFPVDASPGCSAVAAAMLHSFVDCERITLNPPSWSIGAEMVMYAIFPVLMLVKRYAMPIGIITGAALIFLLAPDATAWQGISGPLRALPSFLFGIGLCHASRIMVIPATGKALGVAFVAMLIAMTCGAPVPLILGLVWIVVTLAVGVDMQGKASPLIDRVAPLGQLTYSIYMIHWLVLSVIVSGIGLKLLHLGSIPRMGLAVIAYAIIFGLSYASLRWFETPMRKWITQRHWRAPSMSRAFH